MAEPHYRPESVFIRTAHGLWCPNCEERIDELWPVSCDCCGYPRAGFDSFDDDYDRPTLNGVHHD